jgi:hypothetical protein
MSVLRFWRDLTFQYPCSCRFPPLVGGTEPSGLGISAAYWQHPPRSNQSIPHYGICAWRNSCARRRCGAARGYAWRASGFSQRNSVYSWLRASPPSRRHT